MREIVLGIDGCCEKLKNLDPPNGSQAQESLQLPYFDPASVASLWVPIWCILPLCNLLTMTKQFDFALRLFSCNRYIS